MNGNRAFAGQALSVPAKNSHTKHNVENHESVIVARYS